MIQKSIHDLQNEEHDELSHAKKVVGVSASGDVVAGATEDKQDEIITEVGSFSTLKTSAVTLTTADTAYKLPSTEQTGRRSIILYNISDTDMYYGDSSVTTTNGILLASGAEVSLDISANLYAICGTDDTTIRILELK